MFYLTTHSTHFYLSLNKTISCSSNAMGVLMLLIDYFIHSFNQVHNWFIKGRGMYCSVYGKVHIKDPLLLIEKSGGSRFPSKTCVNVTI